MIMGKKFKAEDDVVKSFISHVRKEGLRRSARVMGLDKNSLSRWIKKGNIPANRDRKIPGSSKGMKDLSRTTK